MYGRTEDLLTLRDREPIDAGRRERLLADPAARAELERLCRTRAALGALPELDPPTAFWARIEAAAAPPRRARGRSRAPRLAAACAAALVVLVALGVWHAARDARDPAADPRAALAAAEPAPAASGPAESADASYRQLVERSIELEHVLARMPAPRPVMTLGTAGTIAGLEQQIAYVDAQLALGTARDLEPRYRQALWSERVDLMTALVQVRYAQSQPTGY